MAIKVLVTPKYGSNDPAIDIKDPVAVKAKEDRHSERHDENRPEVQWTVSPISNATTTTPTDDRSVMLEVGVVYEVRAQSKWFIQNLSDNEDDKLEFSRHGDPEGQWGMLNSGSLIKFEGTLFLLNRTHMENMKVAFIEADE